MVGVLPDLCLHTHACTHVDDHAPVTSGEPCSRLLRPDSAWLRCAVKIGIRCGTLSTLTPSPTAHSPPARPQV
ncbi:unnamed protein product [Urochloa humidicola]